MALRLAILVGTASATMVSSPALASGLSTAADGLAQAEVVAPLIVTREADLAFGALFAGNRSGTVTVSTKGETTYGGGAQRACVPSACFTAHPAAFTVQGEAGRTYAVTVPAQITATGTATDDSGLAAAPLSVNLITVTSASRPDSGGVGQLDANGRDRFQVGGTLEVPAGLPSAQYRAIIPVIVTYS